MAVANIPSIIDLKVNDRMAYLDERPVLLDVPAAVEQGDLGALALCRRSLGQYGTLDSGKPQHFY